MADPIEKPENAGEKQDTRFPPGTSGNPAGKKKGCRNKATIIAEEMLDGEAGEIFKIAIQKAKDGDVAMVKFCGDKILPSRKSRPIKIDLPEIKTAEGIDDAQNKIMINVANGQITPDEGTALSGMLESRRKTLETVEMEKRLEELEANARNRH